MIEGRSSGPPFFYQVMQLNVFLEQSANAL